MGFKSYYIAEAKMHKKACAKLQFQPKKWN